ncbi:MAG TPA: hypothetical protein VK912_01425 [Longimicrobiales bacterium]|nr:hypothetical protein [Longimicrobiales bacterium]
MSIHSGRPERQGDGAPIVEDPRLPRMGSDAAPSTELMLPEERLVGSADAATLPPPLSLKVEAQAGEHMAPFRDEDAEDDAPLGRGEQKERGGAGRDQHDTTKGRSEGYLRLRVRLENGSLSIVGAREVEGPLAFDDSMRGALVYEVRADDRRIGLGSVPDAGEMRSFPSPEPKEGQIGHHVVPLRATEFNIRIRTEDLPPAALDRLSIDVYEMKSVPERPHVSAEPLHKQFTNEARLVARMQGLTPEGLDPRIREDLKRALR